MSNRPEALPAGLVEHLQSDDCPDYVRKDEVERARSAVDRPAFDEEMARTIATRLLLELVE